MSDYSTINVDESEHPEKGDAVLVKFAGIYSHKGGTGSKGPDKAVGFHVVEVKDWNGHVMQAQVPPESVSIKVLEKALPPEPPHGACVMDGVGLVWQRITASQWQAGPSTRSWKQLQDRGKLTRLHPETAGPPLSPDGMWMVWDRRASGYRPVDIASYKDGVSIGAAAFDRGQARLLAKRILSTVGWE